MDQVKKDKSYKIVRPGKRFLSALADLLLLFILASGVFSVLVYPLLKYIPSYKTVLTEQEEYVEKCRQMYIDGKLMSKDIELNTYVDDCIKNKMKDYHNDVFIHYYTVYLPTIHKDGVSFSYNIEFVNNQVYGYSAQEELFIYELDEDISHPLKMTAKAVEMLDKYFNKDITKESETYYNKVRKQYEASLINAEQVLISSDEFNAFYSIVSKDNTILYLHISVSSMITYTIFFFLVYVLMPLIFKNGQTVGKKVTKIGLYHYDDTPIRNNVLILRAILQYITYYFIVMFIPLWQIGNAVINLPMVVFPTFSINLFVIAFFSMVLTLLSLVMMNFSENKQALHDRIVGVNAYRMDVQLEEDNEVKNEEFAKKEKEKTE